MINYLLSFFHYDMRKTEAERKETCHLRGSDGFRITMKETNGTDKTICGEVLNETDTLFWRLKYLGI